MQKNPCRVDDPLQNPIDRETYEDAVSLEDGIYPITTDDNTILDASSVSFDNAGTSLSSTDVEGVIKEMFGSVIKTSTQVVNSPTAKINIPSSGDYIGFVYLSRYTGSLIEEQGGLYVIKRYHETSGDVTHITTVKAVSTRTLDSYAESGSTLNLTFSSNLSNFVQAIVFKL